MKKGLKKLYRRKRSNYMKQYRSGKIGKWQREAWLKRKPNYYKTWRTKNHLYFSNWSSNHPQYFKKWRLKNRVRYNQQQRRWRKNNLKKRRDYMRVYMRSYRFSKQFH